MGPILIHPKYHFDLKKDEFKPNAVISQYMECDWYLYKVGNLLFQVGMAQQQYSTGSSMVVGSSDGGSEME